MTTKKKSSKRRNKKAEFELKLCMLFSEPCERSISLLVIKVSEDKLSDESFSIVKVPKEMKSYWASSVGVGSLGPQCYIIGGDANPYAVGAERNRLPRDVLICTLSCKESKWKKGPMLNGGKPDPIVVTVKGKIFTLAGDSRMWNIEKPQNMFEIFDPKRGNFWRVLPEPPFISLYATHLTFRGHTVIGSIIYLQIADLSDNITLYSFNVDTEIWFRCDDKTGLEDPTHHNLRLGYWFGRADVMDDLMFLTSEDELENLSVYAYDLVARLKDNDIKISTIYSDLKPFIEEQLSRENATKGKYEHFRSGFNDYVFLGEDNVPTAQVFGLTHVKCGIPDTNFDSFVTHLRDGLFALVRCHTSHDSKGIRYSHVWICIFEAQSFKLSEGNEIIERYVVADNVRVADWVTLDLGDFMAWCNVPNDGHQFHTLDCPFTKEDGHQFHASDCPFMKEGAGVLCIGGRCSSMIGNRNVGT